MKRFKFKMLGGTHRNEDGKRYIIGENDEVETNIPLHEKFPAKFTLLEDRGRDIAPTDSVEDFAQDEPPKAVIDNAGHEQTVGAEEPEEPEEPEDEEPEEGLTVKLEHRGGGKYAIYDDDSGEKLYPTAAEGKKWYKRSEGEAKFAELTGE